MSKLKTGMEATWRRDLQVKCHTGFASLPIVIGLMAMILVVGTGVALSGFLESSMTLSSARSSNALYYAEAGAQDALMRIARNKNYTCDSPSSGCYTISYKTSGCSANEGCARITVSSDNSPKVIVSEGRVNNNIRKIQVDVYFDSLLDGEISTTTWREITN